MYGDVAQLGLPGAMMEIVVEAKFYEVGDTVTSCTDCH